MHGNGKPPSPNQRPAPTMQVCAAQRLQRSLRCRWAGKLSEAKAAAGALRGWEGFIQGRCESTLLLVGAARLLSGGRERRAGAACGPLV